MIIKNNVLLSVTSSDLDSNGVLRIPDGVTDVANGVGCDMLELRELHLPDSLHKIETSAFLDNPCLESIYLGEGIKKLHNNVFSGCQYITHIQIPHSWKSLGPEIELKMPRLRRVSRKNSAGETQIFNLTKFLHFYCETQPRRIGNVEISKLYNLYFDADGLAPHYQICLKYKNHSVTEKNLATAIAVCRQKLLMQEFERAAWEYEVLNGDADYNYLGTLRYALRKTLLTTNKIDSNVRKTVRQYIQNIPTYIKYMKQLKDKYKNAASTSQELNETTIYKLLQTIMPLPRKRLVSQSCTRWLKRHPVGPNEMHSIVSHGYKNPGAFPYSWLKNIDKSKRGAATKKLHAAFKRATTKMYSPDEITIQPWRHSDEIAELTQKISEIIKQPVEIMYLDSGNFAKTYTIQIPGDKKYVWKIYHCDRDAQLLSSYHHDTELQNSFLLGGRRYYGKTKFRKICTAGISNQRGEIYLIYPYTEYTMSDPWIYKPYQNLCRYTLVDRNSCNFINNTLVDIGALRINYPRWHQPRYVSKIMNTVLYQSNNNLGYILNNYTSKQIKMAIDFINDKLSRNDLNYAQICKKIEFLKRGAKIK